MNGDASSFVTATPVDGQAPEPGPLVVDRLSVTVLSADIRAAVPMSFGSLENRQVCLVEVSAAGLTGIGESWINYPGWAPAERVATLCDGVFPLLLGKDVADPIAVQGELLRQLLPVGRQWGATGPIWQALSGVDIALWDLLGKHHGVPVSQLLAPDGIRENRTIPAYASGVGPTAVPQLCERALERGLDAVKVKLGFGEDADIATLHAARTVMGEDARLMADANQAWDLGEARRMAHLLEEYRVEWLEEPLNGDRVADLEKLATATGIRIATGENLYGAEQFATYASSAGVHVIQPDLAKSGGFSVAGTVARSAKRYGAELAPHCYSGGLGIAAILQLGAAFEVSWLEYDIRENPLRTELFAEPLGLGPAGMEVPAGPGLGVQLDEDFVKTFTATREERFAHGQ